jgi:hypothetical protein
MSDPYEQYQDLYNVRPVQQAVEANPPDSDILRLVDGQQLTPEDAFRLSSEALSILLSKYPKDKNSRDLETAIYLSKQGAIRLELGHQRHLARISDTLNQCLL